MPDLVSPSERNACAVSPSERNACAVSPLACGLLIVCLVINLACVAVADDWPAFRGPSGNGFSSEKKVTTHWSPSKNVRWKFKLPRPGNGSPIVSNGHVFVTSAEDENGTKRTTYCLDKTTGKLIWRQTATVAEKMPTHKTNPYCGTTPAADGKKVVVWHATAGLFCYGMEGQLLWNREYGEMKHIWGYGTSPIIHDGKVILHSGPGKNTFVTCLDLESGKEIWRTDEPQTTDGVRNENGAYMGSWCTPIILDEKMRKLVLCGMSTRVAAYDLRDGKVVWYCKGTSHKRGDLQYSSPIVAGKLCFITSGYSGAAFAFRIKGTGDITQSARIWRKEQSPQSIGTGIYIDGYVYRPNAGPATIECIDPKTGEIMWKDRGAGLSSWGSIVYAGGNCYLTSQNGSTLVFKPNSEKLQKIVINQLGERCNSTPAISDGKLFIRTFDHLYCIGE